MKRYEWLLLAALLTACTTNIGESSATNDISSKTENSPLFATPKAALEALSQNNVTMTITDYVTAYYTGEKGFYFDYLSSDDNDGGIARYGNQGYFSFHVENEKAALDDFLTPATENVLYSYLAGGPSALAAFADQDIFVPYIGETSFTIKDAAFLKEASTLFGMGKMYEEGSINQMHLQLLADGFNLYSTNLSLSYNVSFRSFGTTSFAAIDELQEATPLPNPSGWNTDQRTSMISTMAAVLPFVPGSSYAMKLEYNKQSSRFTLTDIARGNDPYSDYHSLLEQNGYVEQALSVEGHRFLKSIKAQDDNTYQGAVSYAVDFRYDSPDSLTKEEERALYPKGRFLLEFYFYYAPYLARDVSVLNAFLSSTFHYREGDSPIPSFDFSLAPSSITITDLKKTNSVYSYMTGLHHAYEVVLSFENHSGFAEDIAKIKADFVSNHFLPREDGDAEYYLIDSDFPSDLSFSIESDESENTITMEFMA